MSILHELDITIASIYFWISWLIIPFIVEVIPKVYIFFKVLVDFFRKKKNTRITLTNYPFITVIIPTYNSADLLGKCIQSIVDSTYPIHRIQVILADNQSTDNVKEVYQQIQQIHPELSFQYINAKKGKASGLNAAIYHAIGSYIINIDSDGILEKHALETIVNYLEEHPEVPAAGGTVMTSDKQVEKRAFLQKNEFFEYCQVFLFGRQYASCKHEVFTLAGAFSAFRKEILVQTKLYNTGSIAEDTDMTFQIRTQVSDKIAYCRAAIYYTDAISSVQALFSQRDRWQRGELEVVQNFAHERLTFKNFFKDFVVRQLIAANTFAFLKMIWMFSSVMFLMMHLSWFVLLMSYVLLYIVYVVLAAIYWVGVLIILPNNSENNKKLRRSPQVIFTFPVYNFITFWFRLVGIINYFTRTANWSTASFATDGKSIRTVIKNDWLSIFKEIKK